jgi:hypothetical protein
MFALAALICFILSPFVTEIWEWPTWIVGLAFLALHFLWAVALPWPRQQQRSG